MRSTLQDIAERLKISKATVSRALNGKEGVSQELRRRVLEVANQLNIVTSREVQSQAAADAFALAFVIRRLPEPNTDEDFYTRMMKGAERELALHSYHLVSISIDEMLPESSRLPRTLDKRRLDGLIITGPELSGWTMEQLYGLGLPTVLAANRHPTVEVDSVTSANREGATALVAHLVNHGHRHIVCLSGPREWTPVGDRVGGYVEGMQQSGLTPVIISRPGYLTVEAGYDAAREAFREYPEVTAIFACNDPMAVGVLSAARDAGRSVPDDLAVVGFDNITWSRTTSPALTTVNIHAEEIGALAARRVLELLRTGPQVPIDIRVRNELIVRQSCGCAAAMDGLAEVTSSDYGR